VLLVLDGLVASASPPGVVACNRSTIYDLMSEFTDGEWRNMTVVSKPNLARCML